MVSKTLVTILRQESDLWSVSPNVHAYPLQSPTARALQPQLLCVGRPALTMRSTHTESLYKLIRLCLVSR